MFLSLLQIHVKKKYTFYLIGSLCQDLTEVDSVNVHAMRAVMIALTPLQELEQQLKVLDTHAVFNPLRLYRNCGFSPAWCLFRDLVFVQV